jgi:hypothetical protein
MHTGAFPAVGQLIARLTGPTIGPNIAGAIGATLGELQMEVDRLRLRSASQHLKRIMDHVDVEPSNDSLRALLIDLQQRIIDELADRVFLAIPAEDIEYYSQKDNLFGLQVEARFPQMSEDISEAGKCFALHRGTAAVFHLMRVMEIAVQHFGSKLGVKLAAEKSWQNILDEINKAIKALDQKAAQTKAYAEASSHLYNVKLAWRNEVMHPKTTYTVEEARAVLISVRTFVRGLSEML